MPIKLNELPLEIKELIYKNLSLHDLLTLRSTNNSRSAYANDGTNDKNKK